MTIRGPRRRPFRRIAVIATTLLAAGCTLPAMLGHADSERGTVLFADEFDGPAGPLPEGSWQAAIGGGGWGNNEAQVYTGEVANVGLDGEGHLYITAHRDSAGLITSARLTTHGLFDFTSGRAEARIALPSGAGLHPAFWLLGANLDEAGWPGAGEIDVIETLNAATEYHTGIHAPQTGSERGQQILASGPAPFALAGEFRTYWVERSPGKIVTGVDDVTLVTITTFNLKPGASWVFDAPFFLLLNLAVGGEWPGPVDQTTPFPVTMLVDWVRVRKL